MSLNQIEPIVHSVSCEWRKQVVFDIMDIASKFKTCGLGATGTVNKGFYTLNRFQGLFNHRIIGPRRRENSLSHIYICPFQGIGQFIITTVNKVFVHISVVGFSIFLGV